MYLKREIDDRLVEWMNQSKQKPLLLRGARQVGKTASVRQFSKKFEQFVEVNFEENKQLHKVFERDLSPHRIVEELSAINNTPIEEGKCLLFFDEIQSCIPAIQSLRFFYEKMPKLHLIAAGSLLEFALQEIPSFGVGRIQSLSMYPFSFREYLSAKGETILLNSLDRATPFQPFSEPIHQKLINILRRFIILGGMPEVVSAYILEGNLRQCQGILDDLILTVRDDFKKYKKRINTFLLSEVFSSVVLQTGSKFNYSKAATQSGHRSTKESLMMLQYAGLVIPVIHSNARGLPLGAETNQKKQKMLLFDTGIFLRLLDANIVDILINDNFELVNKGKVAELFVGLELLKVKQDIQNNLYYWHREATNSNAEVDYIIQKGNKLIPIEVKSSGKGAMQSMYLFIKSRNLKEGIRVSTENFSHYNNISVYPLYAVRNIFM